MRSAVAVAAVLSSAVLLAGCGSGPSQVSSAAVVGDTAIPLTYVQDWWDRVLDDRARREQLRQQGQLDDLGRTIATEAVRHELLRAVSRSESIAFDEADVSELIEELGGEQGAIEAINPTIYDRDTVRERARDQLLTAELGRKYFDRTSVRADLVLVNTRDDAVSIAEALAAAPDDSRSVIEEAGEKVAASDLDRDVHMGDSLDLVLTTPLFSVPAGNVVAFTSENEGGPGQWIVAVVHERDTNAEPSDEAGAVTVDDVQDNDLEGVGQRVLALLGRDVEVRLNPRYGVWSDVFMRSIENEGEIPAFVVPFDRPAAS